MPPRRTSTCRVVACGVVLALLATARVDADVPQRAAAASSGTLRQRSAALRTRVRNAVGARAASLRRAPAALASGVARRLPGAGHNRPATAAVPLIGARYERDGATDVTHFRVWAQDHDDVAMEVHRPDGTVERTPMHAEGDGF